MGTTTLSSFSLNLPGLASMLSTTSSGVAQLINNPSPAVQSAIALTLGSAAEQADIGVVLALSVTSGAAYTLNLSGSGVDQFGNNFTMAHLMCALLVNNSTTSGQNFVVGAGTHSVFGSDQITAYPTGGLAFFYNPNAGYTVTVSSTDTFTATLAAGTSVSATLVLLGR